MVLNQRDRIWEALPTVRGQIGLQTKFAHPIQASGAFVGKGDRIAEVITAKDGVDIWPADAARRPLVNTADHGCREESKQHKRKHHPGGMQPIAAMTTAANQDHSHAVEVIKGGQNI